MLPFDSETIEYMQKRFHLAVANEFDVLSGNPPPGGNRANVFDFYDGLRLIVSQDTMLGTSMRHVSASIYPDSSLYRELDGRNTDDLLAKLEALVRARYKEISSDNRELKIMHVSEVTGVPHWYAKT